MAYESIVLCKCSGKYIDIYFSLKIPFSMLLGSVARLGFFSQDSRNSVLVLGNLVHVWVIASRVENLCYI